MAQRRVEAAWCLVGLRLQAPAAAQRPPLDNFVAGHGLEGYSESEALALYEEAYPLARKAARGQRLRKRQLDLLRRLEGLVAETPQPSDLVAGWFDETTAQRLITAGILTLGALDSRIATGGVWWRQMPAIGVAKAHRLERYLATLLPRDAPRPQAPFCLGSHTQPFSCA